jgi:serine/threonine protein phosphatase 1
MRQGGAAALRNMVETDKFAILRGGRRVWTVGAIHGEAKRLMALHDALETRFDVPGDRLVYTGNYLGHGPDVRRTVAELIDFRSRLLGLPGMFAADIVFLRGAQEEMWQKLLQLQFAVNPREVLEWMLAHGIGATLTAYGLPPEAGLAAARDGALSLSRWTGRIRAAIAAQPGHRDLLSALRRAAHDVEGRLLFVHAGLDPARPLASQGDRFWWGAPGFGAWPEPYEGFRRVIRGYDPGHGGIAHFAHAITADGGCGFGGPLTALCLSAEGEIVDRIDI